MTATSNQLRTNAKVGHEKLKMVFRDVHQTVRLEGTVFRREGMVVRVYSFGKQFGGGFDITKGDVEDFVEWAAHRLMEVDNPNGDNV